MEDSIKYLKNNCEHLLPKRRVGEQYPMFQQCEIFLSVGDGRVRKNSSQVVTLLTQGHIYHSPFSKRSCGIYGSGNPELTLHPITSRWF